MKIRTKKKATEVDENELTRLQRIYERSAIFRTGNKDEKTPVDTYLSNFMKIPSLLNIRPTHHQRAAINDDDERLILNVSGDRYETLRTTLERFPQTLLGNKRRRDIYFDKIRGEYFFDRNRSCFESILYFYQSHGRLRRPNFVSLDVFLEEMTFFDLGEEAMKQLRKDENIEEVRKVRLPRNRIRRYIWATLEYPEFSRLALLFHICSMLVILLSTIVFAIETLPQFTHLDEALCRPEDSRFNETAQIQDCHSYFASPFFILQTISASFFTIEFILRLVTTPSIFDSVKNFTNWIAFLAFAPFYVSLAVLLTGRQDDVGSNTYVGLRLLRILRLARIMKFYRVIRSVKSVRVLILTVRQSIFEFFILMTTLVLLAFLFGSAVYFAENDTNGEVFDSIPKSTYWGIITITTVGYGDMYPITVAGRVMAAICALCGTATSGILVSVLVERYQRIYTRRLYVQEKPLDFSVDNIETESRGRSSHANSEITASICSTRRNILTQLTMNRDTRRIHFLIGYVIDHEETVSESLIEKILSIIEDKRRFGLNSFFHRIDDYESNDDSSVKFNISTSSESDEESEKEREINDPFTQIISGQRGKNDVLKTFERRLTETSRNNNDLEDYF